MNRLLLGIPLCIFLHAERPAGYLNVAQPVEVDVQADFLPEQIAFDVDTAALIAARDSFDQLFASTRQLEYAIDFCWIEMHIGSAETAMRVLEQLAPRMPGDASLQLALSFAYEKTGRFQKAMQATQKFYRLKPKACDNTSRFHLKTMEVLANPLGKPENILNLKITVPIDEYRNTRVNDQNLHQYENSRRELFRFLNQFAPFHIKPNKYVAWLYLDLGDLHYLTFREEAAVKWYRAAMEWDPELKEVVNERINIVGKNRWLSNPWIIYGVPGLILLLLIPLWILKRLNR